MSGQDIRPDLSNEHDGLGGARMQATRERLAGAVRKALRTNAALPVSIVAAVLVSYTPTMAAAPSDPAGSASPLLDVTGGDGGRGFVLLGAAISDYTGRQVGEAGDLNGDGITDLLISAAQANPGGRNNAGQTYVVFGRSTPFAAEFELADLLPANGGDGSAGFVIAGVDASDESGIRAETAGDVNGDGLADIVMASFHSSYSGDDGEGEAYVVFGSDEPFAAMFELASLLPANGGDGSRGFLISGADPDDLAGYSISAAGDVNGDGIDDLLVGAVAGDPGGRSGAGEAYVVLGRSAGFPAWLHLRDLQPAHGGDGSLGFVLNGTAPGEETGRTVSWLGDVNGDGVDDFMTGAMHASPDGRRGAGRVYVVFGRAQGFPAAVELAELLPDNGGDGTEGFVVAGVSENDIAGIAISGVGDMNGDGFGELLIAASNAGAVPPNGEVYVVLGRGDGFAPQIELADLLPGQGGDGSEGFVMRGDDVNDLGRVAVSAAGDINGDGLADALIGAEQATTPQAWGGRGYVIYGSSEGFPALLPLKALAPRGGGDGSQGFVIDGVYPNDKLGDDVGAAGDLNGDGIDDLIIGAYGAGLNFEPGRGEAYVVYGNAAGFAPVFELGTLLPLALNMVGDCPGVLEFEIQGLTPRRALAVLAADGPGAAPIAMGPCAGVPTGLDDSEVIITRRAPETGAIYEIENLQPSFCGKHMQVLDVATCTLTNVAIAPR